MRLHRAVVPVMLSVLALSACSDHSDHAASDTTVAGQAADTGDGAASAAFNDRDVEFAQGMIPHHEQAVEMADMALDPAVGASVEVVDLATRIKDAQAPEIDLMKGLLDNWGKEEMSMDGHDMAEHEMDPDDLSALGKLSGSEFDTRWLELMIEHHEGAIVMSEDVTDGGSAPETKALADDIIAAQQAEIDEMKGLLGV